MEKPKDLAEYFNWMRKELDVDVSNKYDKHYSTVSMLMKIEFERSDFWKELTEKMKDFDFEYLGISEYKLFESPQLKPLVFAKEYDSFIQKTYRGNVINNYKWPKEPKHGWIVPDNWFTRTNDIIRTRFVVKYLDGVEFLEKKIIEVGVKHGLKFHVAYEARDEGYYAVHLYTKMDFEIPKMDFNTEIVNVDVEIQITTQLQEVIGKLTHKYYESRRTKSHALSEKWQWNYESEEFTANYLGHILHYVEGMIMEVRNKQSKPKI